MSPQLSLQLLACGEISMLRFVSQNGHYWMAFVSSTQFLLVFTCCVKVCLFPELYDGGSRMLLLLRLECVCLIPFSPLFSEGTQNFPFTGFPLSTDFFELSLSPSGEDCI